MADLADRLNFALAGRYAIQRELGTGGMATVFLAQDLRHPRSVAIKVLNGELAVALGTERFLREIEIAAGLHHPHILPIYDSGFADGLLYLVMPYAEGESLRQRLEREKQLPLEDALYIAREVADALDYAHRRGVVHRDINPGNILFQEQHAVVTDFGIARAVVAAGGGRLTATGVVLGTPAYTSPEQASGGRDLDGRSDQYSLGCVVYEMLAGQPPFTGPAAESLTYQHLSVPARPVTDLRPAVPAETAQAIQRTLAKAPADRFATCSKFAEAFAAGAASAGGRSLLPRPSPAYSPFPAELIDELEQHLRLRESPPPGEEPTAQHVRQERIRALVAILRSHPSAKVHDVVCGVTLVRELARGHYSTVWEGTRISDGQRRAVKIFDADHLTVAAALRQFRRGVKAMYHLNSAADCPRSIVAIDQVDEGTLAFSMPYLPNGDLTHIGQHGWNVDRKLEVFASLCAAVAFAHDHGVYHRDIKPANIVFDTDWQPVLADFDIADPVFLKTVSTRVPGTFEYSAPEQLQRHANRDPRADIHSLGRLLLFLLLERDPDLEIQELPEVKELARFSDQLVRSLRRIIRRCTCKAPASRYTDVAELMTDLDRARRGDRNVGLPLRRQSKPLYLAWTAVAVVLGIAALLVTRPVPPQQVAHRPYRLVGSGTVIEAVVDPFKTTLEKRLGMPITESMTGSTGALSHLLEDSTFDGAMMSRHPDDLIEREPRYTGVSLVYVTVAVGEVVCIVRRDNPLSAMSAADLGRLLLVAPGAMRPAPMRWGDLGVRALDGENVVIFVPARKSGLESGTMTLLQDCLSPDAGYHIWEFLENAGGRVPWIEDIADSFVVKRRDAFGITDRAFVHNPDVKIVTVTGADGKPIVMKRPLMFAARVTREGIEPRMRRLLEMLLEDEMQAEFLKRGLHVLSPRDLESQKEILRVHAPGQQEVGVKVFEKSIPFEECWGLSRAR